MQMETRNTDFSIKQKLVKVRCRKVEEDILRLLKGTECWESESRGMPRKEQVEEEWMGEINSVSLVIYFTNGNIHVSMLFSQIIPPLSSPT